MPRRHWKGRPILYAIAASRGTQQACLPIGDTRYHHLYVTPAVSLNNRRRSVERVFSKGGLREWISYGYSNC